MAGTGVGVLESSGTHSDFHSLFNSSITPTLGSVSGESSLLYLLPISNKRTKVTLKFPTLFQMANKTNNKVIWFLGGVLENLKVINSRFYVTRITII